MNATESEYEPVSDYEGEGAVSDYEARSEFDDTDEWDKDKSMSKRSARVGFHCNCTIMTKRCVLCHYVPLNFVVINPISH